jgi:hypothetical protein
VALSVRRFDKRCEPVFAGLLHNHVQRSRVVRAHAPGPCGSANTPKATTSTPSTSATD